MKVNLTKDQHKKSYFPISLDSSTTANFGEVLPLFCHELVPQSHAKVDIRSAVRFAPLSFPTFGKSFLKTYTYAHKISDLYPPYNDMLAGTPYTGANGASYTPTAVPHVPLWMLWLSVVTNCEFTLYRTDLTKVTKGKSVGSPSTDSFIYSSLPYYPVGNSIVCHEANGNTLNLDVSSISYSLVLWLSDFINNGNSRLLGFEGYVRGVSKNLFEYLQIDSNTPSQLAPLDRFAFDIQGSNCGSVYKPYRNSSGQITNDYVSFDSADFIVPLPAPGNNAGSIPVSSYTLTPGSSSYVSFNPLSYISFNLDSADYPSGSPVVPDVVVAIRLNDTGKMLRKIFMGLGYQLAILNREVSILPIYAYFKSYFETFAPKRFVKFEQSYFARLINECVLTGRPITDIITSSFNVSASTPVFSVRWNGILDDLASCFYTKNTDYFSAQIIGMINDYGTDLSQRYIGVDSNSDAPVIDSVQSLVADGSVPSLNFNSVNHTQAQQNILSRLTQFVNRRSVVGGKVASLLKSVFGISQKEVNEYNAFVGSSSLDVGISDVFSTAETSEASLGEYAGKAVSSGNNGQFNIDVDTHSLLISLMVIVPRTQYVQGVNPILSHITRQDFYNPMYDGLTLLPTRKSDLYVNQFLVPMTESSSIGGSFGNLPIYSEYKTKSTGILSGDLSLRSTRGTYDSFTLDEIISDYNISDPSESIQNTGVYNNVQLDYDSVVAGTIWRYLGRWLWLGRFDRIFVNNRLSYSDFQQNVFDIWFSKDIMTTRNVNRTDDNLIVHHVIDLTINAPMVPLAGSWMTDDLLALGNELKVEGE